MKHKYLFTNKTPALSDLIHSYMKNVFETDFKIRINYQFRAFQFPSLLVTFLI